MKKYTPAQYKKAAVIVHGKSERILASYIYTNLHLPIIIIDNNKGKNSIQINGLQKLFCSKPYNSLKSFAETYSIEYDKKDKTLEPVAKHLEKLLNKSVIFINETRGVVLESTISKMKNNETFSDTL